MRVLLFEDDPDVSETIVSVLTSFYPGCEVVHISEGTAFRRGAWRPGPWDLVLLDLMLPGVTGFEICEAIRANPATKAVPVLALTGYDTLQNEERIKAAGATSYVAKPFEVPVFVKEVSRFLGKPDGI